ncbi:MAG: DUF6114 domain-containing protein [Candidatus Bathyarchaeota archaeon]|nr:DUF6114 domain-containing protein [Candidatus Bathyarchaeota archaeon]
MSLSESYPNTAYILSIIGGIFILLAGLLVGLVSAAITIFMGGIGAIAGIFGIAWGVIILITAFSLRSNPSQHVFWGVIILVFSLVSWVGAAGGFFIGFLLSLIGGILAITWSPPTYRTQQTYVPPTPAVTASASTATQFCPYCGRRLPADAKFCPYCGKQTS